jgi:hypothetical protein
LAVIALHRNKRAAQKPNSRNSLSRLVSRWSGLWQAIPVRFEHFSALPTLLADARGIRVVTRCESAKNVTRFRR